jgi:hypothetical protein
LGNLTGQVAKNDACPVFIFSKSLVQSVYELDRLVEAGSSKDFAVKSQLFGKDRTDQLAFFDSRGFLVDFVELAQVVDRVVNKPFSSFYSGSASISWALFSKFCIQSKQTLH